MLELSSLDLGEIADALADQTDFEHRWLINPQTGDGGWLAAAATNTPIAALPAATPARP